MSNSQSTSRDVLTEKMAKEVRHQIQGLSRSDLDGYTYAREKSAYKDASSDYSVYDSTGDLVLLGRSFGPRTFFWRPTIDPRLAAEQA